MKQLFSLLVIALCISCAKDSQNMTVNGTIHGLKEGTVYLQRFVNDSTLKNIDSVKMSGTENFTFSLPIEEPEVFYIQLDKIDNNPDDDRIKFFGERGTIDILTTLNKFGAHYDIKGSQNNDFLKSYYTMMRPINDRNLEIIGAEILAQKNQDSSKLMALEKEFKNLTRNKYLRAAQFAIQHKDHEIAPYIAAKEIFNANTILDTINSKLSEEMKNSLYGKQLQKLIASRKN